MSNYSTNNDAAQERPLTAAEAYCKSKGVTLEAYEQDYLTRWKAARKAKRVPFRGYNVTVKRLLDNGAGAAILLECLTGWAGQGRYKHRAQIFKTTAEIEQETALTVKEQQHANAVLEALGLVERARARNTMFYRVVWHVLEAWEMLAGRDLNAARAIAKAARAGEPKALDMLLSTVKKPGENGPEVHSTNDRKSIQDMTCGQVRNDLRSGEILPAVNSITESTQKDISKNTPKNNARRQNAARNDTPDFVNGTGSAGASLERAGNETSKAKAEGEPSQSSGSSLSEKETANEPLIPAALTEELRREAVQAVPHMTETGHKRREESIQHPDHRERVRALAAELNYPALERRNIAAGAAAWAVFVASVQEQDVTDKKGIIHRVLMDLQDLQAKKRIEREEQQDAPSAAAMVPGPVEVRPVPEKQKPDPEAPGAVAPNAAACGAGEQLELF